MTDEIVDWLTEQNEHIKTHGDGLTDRQWKVARRLGIRESVYVLSVSEIVFPDWIQKIASSFGLDAAAGFTCDHGILVARNGFDLVAHELVHVAQRERYPSLKAFVEAYISQCREHGYEAAPFEVEARQIQKQYQ